MVWGTFSPHALTGLLVVTGMTRLVRRVDVARDGYVLARARRL